MRPSEPAKTNRKELTPITSHVSNGVTVEMTFDPERATARLVSCREGVVSEQESLEHGDRLYVPYSADNNLLTHRVVLFASSAVEYESDATLIEEVRAFIHKYMDVDAVFEEVAAHYVLMTWRYDLFKELPYLRVLGTYGQGKSRFLLTVGSLCFKPIFASGASTVSPIFRLLDEVGGTLVIDEADFRASDERSEIVKILNNGHAVGFSVLRSDVTPTKEFRPRAFRIFGPKLIATRHEFEDEALESRCFTASLGGRNLRQDIPISLPVAFDEEALRLRNKLLMYRFKRVGQRHDNHAAVVAGASPRLAQILLPLLSVACTPDAISRLVGFATGATAASNSQAEVDKVTLASVKALCDQGVIPMSLKRVAEEFGRRSDGAYGSEIPPRFIGGILRRLGVGLLKTNGVFVVPITSLPKLEILFGRYQLRRTQGQKGREGQEGESITDGSTTSSPSSLTSLT
jgi:hypothetical protein